jgi:hypothetical protein
MLIVKFLIMKLSPFRYFNALQLDKEHITD